MLKVTRYESVGRLTGQHAVSGQQQAAQKSKALGRYLYMVPTTASRAAAAASSFLAINFSLFSLVAQIRYGGIDFQRYHEIRTNHEGVDC